jgi:BolA family transcriptional regulator, general stress-responsive regulator
MQVASRIRSRLDAALSPTKVEVVDESARHAGHTGARPEGETHFRLTIVAETFAGKRLVDRQRLVYTALGDLMRTDIHALSIIALSPAEAEQRNTT